MNTVPRSFSVPSLTLFGWALAFSMIWSSAFVVGKIGLRYTDPYTLLTARFLLAALLLLPVCLATMRESLFGDRTLIRDALLLGAMNNTLYLGLTFTSLRFISPEMVVIVVSCAPFLTSIIAGILGIEKIRVRSIVGIATGFCGVLIITLTRPIGTIDPWGLVLAFLGTVSFATATVFYRNRATLHAPHLVNFWQSVIAALLLMPLAAIHATASHVSLPPLPFVAVVVYLTVVVTIGGMWMWLYLIRRTGATTASTYHLANPFCGLLLSHLVFGTEFRLTDWIGVAVIILGLLNVTRSPRGEKHGAQT